MSVAFHLGIDDVDIEDYELFIDVSSSHGGMVLDHLGLRTADLTGQADAGDFLGRVLLAQALVPADEGTPTVDAVGPGAPMVWCGRRPGYTEDLLGRLERLAEVAQTRGVRIVWG